MNRLGKQPPRYRFILNPYALERFDFCPQCHGPNEVRKFPLFIHVDPRNPFCLNKTCRYCARCNLLIAHQDEIELELAYLLQEHKPDLVGNDYLVMGTLDVEVWERGRQTPLTLQEMLENLHDWEDVRSIQRAGQENLPTQRQRPQQSVQAPRRAAPARHRQDLLPSEANQAETTPAGAAVARSTKTAT